MKQHCTSRSSIIVDMSMHGLTVIRTTRSPSSRLSCQRGRSVEAKVNNVAMLGGRTRGRCDGGGQGHGGQGRTRQTLEVVHERLLAIRLTVRTCRSLPIQAILGKYGRGQAVNAWSRSPTAPGSDRLRS